ncbi:MAG: phosphotyrosine protein phosphatase [Proteobacteria bacterium]|nr:MAG: phosphotyrosine protein phosphatase [Pseudomonadota bacterium]
MIVPATNEPSLIERVGGRQPAARFLIHALLAKLGWYAAYRRVDWSAAKRLVFVCSGNICRSPFAQELARKHGLPAVSFGVDASGGAAADPAACAAALDRGVALTSHVSTSAGKFDTEAGDVFVVMEPRQLRPAAALARDRDVQLTLLGLWCTRPRPYLPDPFGHSDACFRFVFALIEDALGNIRRQFESGR